MSKHTSTKWFLASVVTFVVATVLGAIGAIIAIANDVFIKSGPDVVGVQWTAAAWTALVFCVVAGLSMIGALVAGFVSWIGAVVHTAQSVDKTWFIVLLITGLVGLAFPAMLAYVIAGPVDPPRTQPAAAYGKHPGPVPVS